MGQSGVLRIHAETNLETTREIYTVGQLKRVIVAFMSDNVHRNGCAEMLASIAVGDDDHIDADGIVQALLIYDVADRKWCAADQLSVEHARRIVGANDTYIVPACNYFFLPRCQILGGFVVIFRQLLEVFSLGLIELFVIVVQLSFHRIMRCDLGKRILNKAHPILAIAKSVASVIERNNLLLQHRVDGQSIEAVLLLLVLISARCGQRPSGSLSVAFIPPSVEHGEV